MRLYDRMATPPGGWHAIVPETQTPFEAGSFDELVQKFDQHYRANGFRYGAILEEHVEDIICLDLHKQGIRNLSDGPPLTMDEFVLPLMEKEGVDVGTNVGKIRGMLK